MRNLLNIILVIFLAYGNSYRTCYGFPLELMQKNQHWGVFLPEKDSKSSEGITNMFSTSAKGVVLQNGLEIPLFEGDILLSEEQKNSIALFNVVPPEKLWPGNVFWVQLGKDLPPHVVTDMENTIIFLRGVLSDCVQVERCEYSSNDCKQHIKNGGSVVNVIHAPGQCYSSVGHVGGGKFQNLGISQGCGEITMLHELMHALGLWHEQSREDRDEHIQILWENIEEDGKSNFLMRNGTNTHGAPYNWKSAMHYPTWAFSKNKKPTMAYAKSFSHCNILGFLCPTIGDRIEGFTWDFWKIKKAYGCI